MTDLKVPLLSQIHAYKLTAAARRARLACATVPIDGEVIPSEAGITITLSGKPISGERLVALVGQSAIEIPEFSLARNGKQR